MVVAIVTISVLSFRLFVETLDFEFSPQIGAAAGGIVNAITIMIMNTIWRKVAEILTDLGKKNVNIFIQFFFFFF